MIVLRLSVLVLVGVLLVGLATLPAEAATHAATIACAPRPPVQVTATPAASGVLDVTVRTVAGDPIQAIAITNESNGAASFAPGAFFGTVAHLTVARQTAGLATTVSLTVTDACGPWPTFVGGGPTAF